MTALPLRRLFLLLAAFTFATLAASAQTGLYVEYGGSKVEYGGSKVDTPSDDWITGPTFGGYHDFTGVPFIHLGADLRASVLGISNTTTLTSGMIGPRLSLHPHVLPLMPYIEGLAGVGHYDYGNNAGSATKFQYQFLGGGDLTIFPRVDWRVIEFSYGGLSAFNGTLHPKTISTGLVLRLP